VALVEKFARGSMSIGRDRLYARTELGGLGLIDISSFLQAQQILWVKRCLGQACDNWREDIFNLTYGNPLVLDPTLVDARDNPIIFMIAQSFANFKRDYYLENLNYKKSLLFLNPLITRGQNETRGLDLAFFSQQPEIPHNVLVKIQFKDFYKDGPLSLANVNVNRIFGVELNLLTYMRLTGACQNFSTKMGRKICENNTSLGLREYFNTFKKGSSSLRRVLSKKKTKLNLAGGNPCVKTFLRITNIVESEEAKIRVLFAFWANCFIPNQFREFAYKFCNNALGINTRLSHFVADRGRGCTFCILAGTNQPPDETFLHLFFTCDKISPIREKFYDKFFHDLGGGAETKKRFWFGMPPAQVRGKQLCILSALGVQFGLWSARLKGKIPSYKKIEWDFLLLLATVYKLNKNILFLDDNFFLSRNFQAICQDVLH
jgi:hypothetical protein